MDQPSQPLVSACLIVRNEEANLGRCLASLDGLVDEIVAVDTGSTDRTLDILGAAGARIREETWANDFSLHRNQSLEMASGTWVLVVDADEEVVDTDIGETRRRLLRDGLPDLLLALMQLDYPDGRVVRTAVPRLFRNQQRMRFIHAVHEQLDVKEEPAALSNVRLRHHGYSDPSLVKAKEERNLSLARSMARSSHAHHCIARAAFSLGDWETVIRAAEELNTEVAPALLRLECAALAAASSLNLGRVDDLERFANAVEELAPESPDSRLLAALTALLSYDRVLRSRTPAEGRGFALRPSVFPHDRDVALRAIQALHLGAHRPSTTFMVNHPDRGAP